MTFPQLKRHLTVHQSGPTTWYLLGETDQIQCEGSVYGDLLPLLNGKHHEDDMPDLLPQYSPSLIYYALIHLSEHQVLVQWPAANNPENEQERFVQSMGWRDREPITASKGLRLHVKALQPLRPEPLARVLAAAEFGLDSHQPDLLIWLVPHYEHPDLTAINQQMLAEKQPWLLVNPTGVRPWLGPWFVPQETACWQCLFHRLQFNQPTITHLRQASAANPPAIARPSTVLSRQLVYHQLGLFLQAANHGSNTLLNRLWVYDLPTHTCQQHSVIKRPQCKSCGAPPSQKDALKNARVHLPASPIRVMDDGGYRDRGPQETLDQYAQHVSPITGIVRQLRAIDGPHWAYNVDAGPNLALHDPSMTQIKDRYRYLSGGKGKTATQAMASGLCEAIERVCAIYDPDCPHIRERKDQLPYKAYNPNDLMLYSQDQWAHASSASSTDPYRLVPQPFDPQMALDWAPVWSLTHAEPRFVPLQYAYGGAPHNRERVAYASSNGNAAGNNLSEAVLQGLYELIERDAVAIWWYNRLQRPCVDLTTHTDPYCQQLLAAYQQINRDMWVLDLSHDLSTPVYAAISAARDETPAILVGFGAHSDARIALERALVEMNQLLPLVYHKDGKAQQSTSDPAVEHWLKHATLANQPYLRPSSAPPTSLPTPPQATDCKPMVESLVQQLAEQGLEVLVLNLTRPDIGLPVVKVMVPGLRHFWPRFAPGRLFDVPVKMGWCEQARTEATLNPISVFF